MARPVCTQCLYPLPSCVCAYLHPTHNDIHVWIMQHPHELSQAKSTVPLALLSLDNVTRISGENPSDFHSIQALDFKHCALLYPDEQAKAVETLGTTHTIEHLIVLDGTWDKVHKLTQLNPWLEQIHTVSFAQVPTSRYLIRKANRDNSLSTLEAIAYSLNHLEQLDTQPLLTLLDGFVHQQTRHMSDAVKQRYK